MTEKKCVSHVKVTWPSQSLLRTFHPNWVHWVMLFVFVIRLDTFMVTCHRPPWMCDVIITSSIWIFFLHFYRWQLVCQIYIVVLSRCLTLIIAEFHYQFMHLCCFARYPLKQRQRLLVLLWQLVKSIRIYKKQTIIEIRKIRKKKTRQQRYSIFVKHYLGTKWGSGERGGEGKENLVL